MFGSTNKELKTISNVLNNSYFCIIKTFRQQIIGSQFDNIDFLSKKFNQIGRLQ